MGPGPQDAQEEQGGWPEGMVSLQPCCGGGSGEELPASACTRAATEELLEDEAEAEVLEEDEEAEAVAVAREEGDCPPQLPQVAAQKLPAEMKGSEHCQGMD